MKRFYYLTLIMFMLLPTVASAQIVKEGEHIANVKALPQKPLPHHHRPHQHQTPVTYPR